MTGSWGGLCGSRGKTPTFWEPRGSGGSSPWPPPQDPGGCTRDWQMPDRCPPTPPTGPPKWAGPLKQNVLSNTADGVSRAHFTDKEAEAQGGGRACPVPPERKWRGTGLESGARAPSTPPRDKDVSLQCTPAPPPGSNRRQDSRAGSGLQGKQGAEHEKSLEQVGLR